MLRATSADGTVLGAEVVGSGPGLLLVHGGTADRTRGAPLVPHLQDDFTLLLDRRGRGASTDEAPDYALAREGEDLLAVQDAFGEDVAVFGHSYGATVTLQVLDRLRRPVVLYEPPFATSEHQVAPPELLRWMDGQLLAGHREAVLEAFYLQVLGFPPEAVADLRRLPVWQHRLDAVHTLPREAWAANGYVPQALTGPATTYLLGDSTAPFLDASTRAAHDAQPGARLVVMPGQGHVAIDANPALVAGLVRAAVSSSG